MNSKPDHDNQSVPALDPAAKSTLLERFVMPLLGVPQRHFMVIHDTSTAQTLWFHAIALVACAGGFVWTTTTFSHVLIGNSLPVSLLVGLMAGAVLFFIDRQTLLNLRIEPEGGRGKAWVIRIATVAMGLMMALIMGTWSHGEDIARLQAEKARAAAAQAIRSAEYSARARAAESALEQATRDVSRKAMLDAELTLALSKRAEAEIELAREIRGAFDPRTGQARKDGHGPKARYWETERDGAGDKVRAIQAELLTMGDPAQRQAEAQTALKVLQAEITNKALQQQQGPAKKLGLLFQLLREEWTTWLSLGYGVALAILADFMMLFAMAPSKCVKHDYEIINQFEEQRSRSLAFLMADKIKAEIASAARPARVRISTPQRKAGPTASRHSAHSRDAGLAAEVAE